MFLTWYVYDIASSCFIKASAMLINELDSSMQVYALNLATIGFYVISHIKRLLSLQKS